MVKDFASAGLKHLGYALCGLGLALIASQLVIVNVTESEPYGLYVRSIGGGYVTACPVGEASALSVDRGYRPGSLACPDGHTPLLKNIAASAGDLVVCSAAGISVNGRLLPNTAPLSHDSAGRALPHYPFAAYTVPAGYVWLVSSSPISYDSRYCGPFPAASISGHWRALWVTK